tara:strand:- start:30505 stop:30891 length:387 start_codon:yes stop_codon:yes gene_type:complete
MGYWHTNSGKKFKVNLEQDLIEAMKDEGACFCWFKDNPGINDKNNETFYMTEKDDEEESRVLREDITVTAENGHIQPRSGYVSHWVENKHGETTGTDIKGWFIFQPGKYPTHYMIKRNPEEDVVVTDL